MRLLLIILSFCLVSCAGLRSRYHHVATDQSWASVASQYGVSVEELQQHNSEVKRLEAGTKLYIPFEESPTWNAPRIESREVAAAKVTPTEVRAVHFTWPLTGYVSSGFGRRHNKDHEGIDIPAPKGTPVKAARSGHVIYAGNKISGYGNLVIVRHADSYSSVYAHLSKMDVKKGQFVSRGQKVGRVGRTGHATANHLHFEIRNRQTPVNPLLYLQAQYATNILGR